MGNLGISFSKWEISFLKNEIAFVGRQQFTVAKFDIQDYFWANLLK